MSATDRSADTILFESTERDAVESWIAAAPAALAGPARMGLERLGGALLVHAGATDVLMFNRVLGLGALEPPSGEPLDHARERFLAVGAKRFMVQVAPGPWAAELEALLTARGYRRHNHWIRLARDARPAAPPSTDLRIDPMPDAYAMEFGGLIAQVFAYPPEAVAWTAALFGRPGWRFFGAFEGAALAGGVALHQHGEGAWFGFAATRPEFRGRGAQTALIARRIAEARTAGARWCVTETAADTPEKPNPSTHNMRRMGFADAYERVNWVLELPPATG